MAYTTDERGSGGSGAGSDVQLAAREAAEALNALSLERGRCWVAVVSDTSLWATKGTVYANLDGSEVEVICPSTSLSVGQAIVVSKFANTPNSPYVLHEHAGVGGEDGGFGLYELAFPDASLSPSQALLVGWSGVILATGVIGAGATGSLSLGGLAVGVGDAVAAGDSLVLGCTGTGQATVWVKVG